jgi:hypothetical protein
VNLLGDNIGAINKKKHILIDAGKEVDVELTQRKLVYVAVSLPKFRAKS